MKRKSIFYAAAVVGVLVFAVTFVLYTKHVRLQEEIAEKVLRFHVLANSDSAEDQNLKLKVRDAVGVYLGQKLQDVDNLSECEKVVDDNLDGIVSVAREVILKEGYQYPVTANVVETSFPVKTYGAYTFPAGDYEALRVVIGAGEGHNWWCVLYPNMCFSGSMYEVTGEEAEQKLREVLDEEEYEQILKEGNYKIQFKYLPFLNSLANSEKTS